MKTSLSCLHCGNPVPVYETRAFCCSGCETVYHWIQSQNFDRYYDIKNKARSVRKLSPVLEPSAAESSLEKFRYLDDPEFRKNYSWQTAEAPEDRWMDFYVEGVHCAACVWLTEKVAEIVAHVGFIRLNLATSVAKVRIDSQGSFAEVALALQKMGYRPHPVRPGESEGLRKLDDRKFLMRIGVAGACAGNIMLLAISLYSGAEGIMAERFRWISFGLFLPVLGFSATPFYQSAWAALSHWELSIDIPVIFGILLGSVVSIVNLFSGDDRIYFDSLAALIFLLLSTRFALKRTQQKALDSSRLLHFLTPNSVKTRASSQNPFKEIPLEQLSVGDQVQILPGEYVPVDGIIIQGESLLDCALFSGESNPEKVVPGQLVFSGTLNLDSPLEVKVTQSGTKTRMGRIVESMEKLLTQKAEITEFADRVSKFFVAAVFILSALTFAWGFQGKVLYGLNKALAIAIVTCPCTFALITPLAISMSLGRLARAGILVKGPHILEKLTRIHSIFLDKTGTLTFGTPQVLRWDVPKELWEDVLLLEAHSNHPVAKSLVRYLRPLVLPESHLIQIQDIQETRGLGIRGRVGSDQIEIRRATDATQGTEIIILKNNSIVGRAILTDQIRPEAKSVIQKMKAMDFDLSILSGDHSFPVEQIGAILGIPADRCISQASPEKKNEVIKNHPQALMIGDGVNDALALAQADVGIAVHSGVEIGLRAADIYITTPGLAPVHELLVVARETLRVVRRNFGFSIIYNLIAGGFALAGKIDPLFAAVLMPLSAFTVYLSTIAGTIKMRHAFRELEK